MRFDSKSVAIHGGIDSASDPRRVGEPYVVDLVDGVFTAAPGVRRRFGHDPVPTFDSSGDAITVGAGLMTRNDELCMLDDDRLYTYDDKRNRWIDRARCASVRIGEEKIAHEVANQTEPVVCTHNDTTVVAWLDSRDSIIHYSVINASTGAVYTQDTAITGADHPRLCVAGNMIHLYYYKASGTSLNVKPIFSGDPLVTGSPDVQLATDVGAATAWNVTTGYDGRVGLVVYRTSGFYLKAFYVTAKGQVAPAAGATEDTYPGLTTLADLNSAGTSGYMAQSLHVATTATHMWAVFNHSSITPLIVAAIHITRATANQLSDIVDWYGNEAATYGLSIVPDPDNVDVAYVAGATASDTVLYDVDAGAQSITSTQTLMDATVQSAGIWYEGNAYFVIAHNSVLQSTNFLVDQDAVIIGAFGRSVASPATTVGGSVYLQPGRITPVNGSATKFRWVEVYRERFKTGASAADDYRDDFYDQKSLKLVTLDFGAGGRYRSITVGGAAYLAGGGQLWHYDGFNCVESGFHLYPEASEITDYDDTGGSMTAGTYNYRVYYEWHNARGERFRSASQTYTAVVAGANTEMNLTIPTLTFTNKTDVSIVIYRTEADADIVGGAVFYRVSDADPSTAGAANGYCANTKSAATITFVDQMPDSALVSREYDYMSTGAFANIAPPPASIVAEGNGRVWLAGFEDGNQIWPSKLRGNGEPVEFSDELAFMVPDEGGPITALMPHRNLLLVFKRDVILAIPGQGPDDTGGGGFFGEPQVISRDVGTINQLGVVQTPVGVFFQSDKGLRLLDAGLTLARDREGLPIGEKAQRWKAADIRGAVVVADQNQVRFTTTGSRQLVFDYAQNAWSTFSNTHGIAAIMWDQRFVFLRADGQAWIENPDSYNDGGYSYPLRILGAWHKPDGAGAQRLCRFKALHILGDYHSAHKLVCRFRYSYHEEYDELTFDPAGIVATDKYGYTGAYGALPVVYGGAGSSSYQVTFHPPQQRAKALQWELYDIPTTEADRGYEVIDLTIEAGMDQHAKKLPASQKA